MDLFVLIKFFHFYNFHLVLFYCFQFFIRILTLVLLFLKHINHINVSFYCLLSPLVFSHLLCFLMPRYFFNQVTDIVYEKL